MEGVMRAFQRDDTLAEIVDRHLVSQDFVRHLLAHMVDFQAKNGEARVTIGVTGDDDAPDYRISAPYVLSRIVDGHTHFVSRKDLPLENAWSTRMLSVRQVREVLARLSGDEPAAKRMQG
jgi:hypothetical protein